MTAKILVKIIAVFVLAVTALLMVRRKGWWRLSVSWISRTTRIHDGQLLSVAFLEQRCGNNLARMGDSFHVRVQRGRAGT